MVHFSGKARKMNHLSSFCASEVCLHPESLRESYGLNNLPFFISLIIFTYNCVLQTIVLLFS
ncbi:MAG: hypothetical protein U5L45_02535 [Saprospiraceae bacterium]|nr:hypothetical protein [Saprospiraceae bacterium]